MIKIVISRRLASPRVIYECRIELFGLSIAPQLRDGFDHYRLKWMTRPLISYSPPLVREFYVSYCATVSLTMPKRAILRHVEHLQLKQTLMRRVMFDIFVEAIYLVLFGPD